MTSEDLAEIKHAKKLLENNSFASKVGNFFGQGLSKSGHLLPEGLRQKSMKATIFALHKSWHYSMKTMPELKKPSASKKRHKTYALISGAVGGVGIITLFIELPITTIIMMRSIADIAKEYGENYHEMGTKFACLEVFAFGGDDNLKKETGDIGYYATRKALSHSFDQSSIYIAQKTFAGMGAPLIAQVIAKVALHFNRAVMIALTAKIIPMVGAVMGATINYIFLDHFQEKAKGHFIIRRLERKYSSEVVKQAYIDCKIQKSLETVL